MPHPSDKKLDELQQLLETSYRECVDKSMPFMASLYEDYVRALRSLRISHENLQEQLLANDEADDQSDDETVESQIFDFVKDQFMRNNNL